MYFMSRYTHAVTISQAGSISVEKFEIRGADEGYMDYLAQYEPFN